MAATTKISWCDSTWSPWRGCEKISPGCKNCYAEKLVNRFGGDFSKRVIAADATFNAPLKWAKKPWVCDECGTACSHHQQHECPTISKVFAFPDETGWHRRRIFLGSLMDILDPKAPIEALARVFDIIRRTPECDYLLVTKRPELWRERIVAAYEWIINNTKASASADTVSMLGSWIENRSPRNIWIIATVENQEMADKRIPELLKIPAVVRGLSVEPMLGPIDFNGIQGTHDGRGLCWDIWGRPSHIPHCDYRAIGKEPPNGAGIRWAIFGGESGPNARPCNIDWIRDGVRQCRAAGVAPYVKQLGSRPVKNICDDRGHYCGFEGITCKHRSGADPSEWPSNLRVQEYPEVRA